MGELAPKVEGIVPSERSVWGKRNMRTSLQELRAIWVDFLQIAL